jgi:hypothetical protein
MSYAVVLAYVDAKGLPEQRIRLGHLDCASSIRRSRSSMSDVSMIFRCASSTWANPAASSTVSSCFGRPGLAVHPKRVV